MKSPSSTAETGLRAAPDARRLAPPPPRPGFPQPYPAIWLFPVVCLFSSPRLLPWGGCTPVSPALSRLVFSQLF